MIGGCVHYCVGIRTYEYTCIKFSFRIHPAKIFQFSVKYYSFQFVQVDIIKTDMKYSSSFIFLKFTSFLFTQLKLKCAPIDNIHFSVPLQKIINQSPHHLLQFIVDNLLIKRYLKYKQELNYLHKGGGSKRRFGEESNSRKPRKKNYCNGLFIDSSIRECPLYLTQK